MGSEERHNPFGSIDNEENEGQMTTRELYRNENDEKKAVKRTGRTQEVGKRNVREKFHRRWLGFFGKFLRTWK